MHNYHRLVKGKARLQLLMHPDDLASRGIASGKVVELSSRIGILQVPVEASTDMMPGVVCLPHGWGHDREGTRLGIASTLAGASYNDVSDDKYLDAISGNAALNGIAVEVRGLAKLYHWRGVSAIFGLNGPSALEFRHTKWGQH